MVKNKYAIAYCEVLEILKHISKEDYDKLPQEKIDVFEANASKDYEFKYDTQKTLNEQNVSKEAKAIIGILFRDYWATEEQRKTILKMQNFKRKMIEKEKQEKYNNDNLFKKEQINEEKNNIEETKIVEHKESFFAKILGKIKKFFKF